MWTVPSPQHGAVRPGAHLMVQVNDHLSRFHSNIPLEEESISIHITSPLLITRHTLIHLITLFSALLAGYSLKTHALYILTLPVLFACFSVSQAAGGSEIIDKIFQDLNSYASQSRTDVHLRSKIFFLFLLNFEGRSHFLTACLMVQPWSV